MSMSRPRSLCRDRSRLSRAWRRKRTHPGSPLGSMWPAPTTTIPTLLRCQHDSSRRSVTLAWVTTYPEALNGWTMTDAAIHNEAGAERHWRELAPLFADTLCSRPPSATPMATAGSLVTSPRSSPGQSGQRSEGTSPTAAVRSLLNSSTWRRAQVPTSSPLDASPTPISTSAASRYGSLRSPVTRSSWPHSGGRRRWRSEGWGGGSCSQQPGVGSLVARRRAGPQPVYRRPSLA